MSTDIAAEVDRILSETDGLPLNDIQSTAWNYLVDYTEHPEWFGSHEGQRLLHLCLQVLKGI